MRFVFSRALLFGLSLLFSNAHLLAQEQHLVFFKDKKSAVFSLDNPSDFLSERALARRERQDISVDFSDLPVSAYYLDTIQQVGAEVIYTSRWFNAALILCTQEVGDAISTLSFIDSVDIPLGTLSPEQFSEWNDEGTSALATSLDYGNSFTQNNMLGVDQMHASGFQGEGIWIALLDGGYANANRINGFDSLFSNGRILGTYDFVDREEDVYDDHRHGMQVLAAMAAYDPGNIIGPAYKAGYFLFRTEDVSVERRKEEFLWAVAAEYADSAGADIITASLGYNLFDDPKDDYTPGQMDGSTTLVSQAAGHAASKGILVVTSAGNEGNDDWQTVTAPADHKNVLAVGAVDANRQRVEFSSTGPTADGRIKPNVMAQGRGVVVYSQDGRLTTTSGTSFAAPLVAGLAAGIWQAIPQLTNRALLAELEAAADNSASPNNEIGHGIPHFSAIAEKYTLNLQPNGKKAELAIWPNPTSGRFQMEFPFSNGAIKLILQDLLGRLVWQQEFYTFKNQCSVSLPSALKGHFILRAISKSYILSTPIILY